MTVPSEYVPPRATPASLAAEVKTVRIDHNVAPDDAIPVTARVLAAHVGAQALRRSPACPGRAYWQPGA